MPDPMKIRATANGDKIDVKVLMAHEMETGFRKDPAGAAHSGALHSNGDRRVQRQDGAVHAVGAVRVEKSVPVVPLQRRRQGRQGQRDLARQCERDANRRGSDCVTRRDSCRHARCCSRSACRAARRAPRLRIRPRGPAARSRPCTKSTAAMNRRCGRCATSAIICRLIRRRGSSWSPWGPASISCSPGKRTTGGYPFELLVDDLIERGVRFEVCVNTLDSRHIDRGRVHRGSFLRAVGIRRVGATSGQGRLCVSEAMMPARIVRDHLGFPGE